MGVKMGQQKTARTFYESHQRTVDYTTGEIIDEKSIIESKLPPEPPYVKLYVDDLGSLLGLERGEKRVLLALACSLDFEGFASVTAAKRKRLAERCELTIKSFNNAVSALAKKGLIKVVGSGEYELNPNLFARGDWKSIFSRRQTFKLEVTYSPETGRTISTTAVPETTLPTADDTTH